MLSFVTPVTIGHLEISKGPLDLQGTFKSETTPAGSL